MLVLATSTIWSRLAGLLLAANSAKRYGLKWAAAVQSSNLLTSTVQPGSRASACTNATLISQQTLLYLAGDDTVGLRPLIVPRELYTRGFWRQQMLWICRSRKPATRCANLLGRTDWRHSW